MSLAGDKEVKLMIKMGLLKFLVAQISTNPTRAIKVNSIWALSNLANSSDEVKLKILEEEPEIFKMILK